MVPPVNLRSQNARLLRSPGLAPASGAETFSFPPSNCQTETAFMEEERVETPKVHKSIKSPNCCVKMRLLLVELLPSKSPASGNTSGLTPKGRSLPLLTGKDDVGHPNTKLESRPEPLLIQTRVTSLISVCLLCLLTIGLGGRHLPRDVVVHHPMGRDVFQRIWLLKPPSSLPLNTSKEPRFPWAACSTASLFNIKKIPFYIQSKSTLLQFKTATNPPKLTAGLCSTSLSTLHAQNQEEPAQLLLLKLRKMRTGGCNGTCAALAS